MSNLSFIVSTTGTKSTKTEYLLEWSTISICDPSDTIEIPFAVKLLGYDNSEVKTIDDVEFVVLNYTHSSSNKAEKVAEARKKMSDDLKQQADKIAELEKSRTEINLKLESTDTSFSSYDLKSLHEKITEISKQIGAAKKIHEALKVKDQEVKYEDSTDTYSIKISRDATVIIEGLPDQKFTFKFSWTKPTVNKARIEKTNVSKTQHSLTIMN